MAILKVLVVDDEPGIRSGIKRILGSFKVDYPFLEEEFHYEVIEASTGEEALEIIEKNTPDAILLDNKLPGIQGIDVLEEIYKKESKIPVMMITSYASLELAVKATNNGAYDFVPKPFTPQELKTAMENLTKHMFLKRMTRQMNKEGKQIRFQFLSVLSHELKAPLNAIQGYLDMVKNKQFGDKVESYNEIIDRSVARVKGMRNLIMDLLDLTKLETTKSNRELVEFNIIDCVKSAMDTMFPYAIQRDIKMRLSAPDEILFSADRDEFEIIMNNLISNAIKYNKTHGKVDIKLETDSNFLNIEVEDTGLGISENDLPRLFNEFVRIKTPETRKITGSGLGLSIVKKLVSLYNGEISVKSEIDIGSKFLISIPLSL